MESTIVDKLYQLSENNKSKQEIVQLIKDNTVVYVGTREKAEKLLIEGEEYRIIDSSVEEFKERLLEGTFEMVNYIAEKCEEFAEKGYGSVIIDFRHLLRCYGDEAKFIHYSTRNRVCYSISMLYNILEERGFTFNNHTSNRYIADTDVIIWNTNAERVSAQMQITVD